MATQSARVYKQTLVKMLNYVKPGNGWTVDSVLSVEDLTLTDVQCSMRTSRVRRRDQD